MPMASASSLVRGIAQQQHVPARNDRCVGLGDAELLEQLIHLRIGLQVQPGEPDPVPG